MTLTNNYHRAALLFFVSAALQVVVIAVSGGEFLAQMLGAAVLWVLLGLGLMREWRSIAYFAFVLGLMGMIVALGFGMSEFGLTATAFMGIAAADLLAVVLLFGTLWQSFDPVATA